VFKCKYFGNLKTFLAFFYEEMIDLGDKFLITLLQYDIWEREGGRREQLFNCETSRKKGVSLLFN